MAFVKVMEVIASSEKSFDDAVQQAVNQAAKQVDNISSVYVKEMKANVTNNKIVSYGINAKISYDLDKGNR